MLSWFSLGKLFFRIHDVQHFDLSGVVSVYCLYPPPELSHHSPAPARINKEGEWTRRDQRTTSYAEQFLRGVEMLHSSGSSGRHGRVNWHFYNDCPAAAAAGQRWCGCGGGAVQISNIWPKCQRRAELQLEWWRCLHSALQLDTKVCQVFTITGPSLLLKMPTSAFTLKNVLRHYDFTISRCQNMVSRHEIGLPTQGSWQALSIYSNQTTRHLQSLCLRPNFTSTYNRVRQKYHLKVYGSECH